MGRISRRITLSLAANRNAPSKPAIPQPIRGILWELSKMHNDNILEFTADLERVHYDPQPVDVKFEGFFADGIHPSEQGYRDWADAMLRHFDTTHKWK